MNVFVHRFIHTFSPFLQIQRTQKAPSMSKTIIQNELLQVKHTFHGSSRKDIKGDI